MGLLACLVTRPIDAQAWGAEGHRLIADVAESKLSWRARAEITRLLALEPGATLASVSTWADEFRSPPTAPWHYVNLPRDTNCRYDSERSCIQGACVVGAIERHVAVLASKAPDLQRLKALKYVVHFVADAHQPLHAGFADDRGGNNCQLQAFGRGTNLHAVWDTGLIQQWPGGAASMRAAVVPERSAVDATFSPGSWAEESCRVVQAEGFYPARQPTSGCVRALLSKWGPRLTTRRQHWPLRHSSARYIAANRSAAPHTSNLWVFRRHSTAACNSGGTGHEHRHILAHS